MDLLAFLVLLAILARVSTLETGARVTEEEFRECLSRTVEPAVIETERRLSRFVGAARFAYVLVFRGHRIRHQSRQQLQLPSDVALIRTSRL